MKPDLQHHRRARAFTLIELVLALAIAGIVLTAINSVFFAAIHLRNATVKVAEQTAPVERAMDIVKRDIAGIVPPGDLAGAMGTDATMVGVNQPLVLEFFTTTGVLQDDVPWGDTQKIDYWLQDQTNRNSGTVGKDLIRGITRNLLTTTPLSPEPHKLLGGIDTFRFSFFDGTNWNDAWPVANSNTPVAVKAFFTFATPKGGTPSSPPIQFIIPVLIESSTNMSNTNGSASTNTAT